MTSYPIETGRFAKPETVKPETVRPALREAGSAEPPDALHAKRRDGGPASLYGVQRQAGAVAETLRQDYGLTAAETRVAIALADGMSVPDICASQKIGQPTVRSHLKSTFRKTETSGQVQLVVLVFKLLRELVSEDGKPETPRQVLRRSA